MKNKFKTKIAFALLVALLSACDTSNSNSFNNSTNPIGSASVTTPSVTLPDSNVPSVTVPSVTVPSTNVPSVTIPSTNPPVSNTPSVSTKPSQSTSQTSTVVVEGKWQYFLQSDSSASRDFMRTPYIEGVTPSVDDSYYSSAFGKSGSSLLNSLKSIVGGSISRSYDWSRFEKVDEDPNNSSNVFCIYSRTSYGKSAHVNGANTWNREHTYPQSKISKDAAKDSILIFADDWKTNGARSNYVFGEVAHNSSTAVKDSANRVTANYRQGSTFEPCDAAKGEVARATLYTYVVYGHSVTGNFTSLDICLKWNKEFPVTSWEILRNNRNYSVQGNRNPFIDHPEFANLLF